MCGIEIKRRGGRRRDGERDGRKGTYIICMDIRVYVRIYKLRPDSPVCLYHIMYVSICVRMYISGVVKCATVASRNVEHAVRQWRQRRLSSAGPFRECSQLVSLVT